MDRLTSFDTSFLTNEKANGHMAIGAVLVCDGPAPSLEEFTTHVRSRLHLLPRLRQRLSFPPLGLGTPFWVDDPEFDLRQHVRQVGLPAPGSVAQFRELAASVLAPPLDRCRPLWELCLVDGFEEERFGIVYKTHHAMADGISAVDIGTLLFDVEPDAEPVREVAGWDPHALPTNAHLAAAAGRGIWATLRRALHWLRRALRDPPRAARRAADSAAGLREVGWALTKPAPSVPFNVEIGPNRAFSWASAGLEDFKRIKNTFGGTVNDVSLAVSAGALRRWLEDRGVATDGLELRALVPVSIRAEDEHGQLGNRLTAMRGPLPVQIADPVARLRAVATAMDDLKASKQPMGAQAMWALGDWIRDFAPPILLTPAATVNFSTRLFNLLVTNFPGPQIPLYVLGRELTGVYPVGFLAQRHALALAIISYNGAINFGLIADPDSVDDLDRIAAHIDAEVAELLAAVGQPAG
ncbi:MAG: wax ester/triacylglycerol synthase family O-acyltransferase [Solirubrobacterales bacterium]